VWTGAPLADVGAFIDASRELRADMDSKRVWPDVDGFADLLGTSQEGKPVLYSGP
jgi:hypothetical protein